MKIIVRNIKNFWNADEDEIDDVDEENEADEVDEENEPDKGSEPAKATETTGASGNLNRRPGKKRSRKESSKKKH